MKHYFCKHRSAAILNKVLCSSNNRIWPKLMTVLMFGLLFSLPVWSQTSQLRIGIVDGGIDLSEKDSAGKLARKRLADLNENNLLSPVAKRRGPSLTPRFCDCFNDRHRV